MDSVIKVTPLDIRKKSFDKVTFGGYDKEDVNAFLQALSVAWENLSAKNEELERRLTDSESELNRIRQIEAALLSTLKQVEDSNHIIREQARKEAYLIIQESENKATQIVEEAKSKARIVTKEANQLAYNAVEKMREELRKLDYSYRLLEKQKERLTVQMSDFLKDTLTKINQIDTYKRTVYYDEEIKKANQFMQYNNEQTKQELKDLGEEKHTQSNFASQVEKSEQKQPTPYVNGKSMNGVNGSHHSQENGIHKEKEYELASFFDTL
jgi:cell division initiation protein